MTITRESPAPARPGVVPADAGTGLGADRRIVEADVEAWARPDPVDRWRLLRPARI